MVELVLDNTGNYFVTMNLLFMINRQAHDNILSGRIERFLFSTNNNLNVFVLFAQEIYFFAFSNWASTFSSVRLFIDQPFCLNLKEKNLRKTYYCDKWLYLKQHNMRLLIFINFLLDTN